MKPCTFRHWPSKIFWKKNFLQFFLKKYPLWKSFINFLKKISNFNKGKPRKKFLIFIPWLFFCQVFGFCVVVPRMLRIWEYFFYSQAFFTLHPFPHLPQNRECYRFERAFLILRRFLPYTPSRHLAQPSFIKAFLGAGSSSLKVPGPPTNVRNTHPAHLFVWITQCSPKGISR